MDWVLWGGCISYYLVLTDAKPNVSQSNTPPSSRRTQTDYTPLSGQDYFTEALEVETKPGSLFRVYYSPPPQTDDSTVFVFHQGAGYTGLSFACLTKELRRLSGDKLGMLAFDARAHGRLVRDDLSSI